MNCTSMDWKVVTFPASGDHAAMSYGASIKWTMCGCSYQSFGTLSLLRSTTFPNYFVLFVDGPESKDKIYLPTEAKWLVETKRVLTKTRGIKVLRTRMCFGPGSTSTGVDSIEFSVGCHEKLVVAGIELAQSTVQEHQDRRGY